MFYFGIKFQRERVSVIQNLFGKNLKNLRHN
jgi:hypothetical protein